MLPNFFHTQHLTITLNCSLSSLLPELKDALIDQ